MSDVDAVERIQDAFVAEVNLVLVTDGCDELAYGSGIGASDGKIIDLTGDENPSKTPL